MRLTNKLIKDILIISIFVKKSTVHKQKYACKFHCFLQDNYVKIPLKIPFIYHNIPIIFYELLHMHSISTIHAKNNIPKYDLLINNCAKFQVK